MEKRISGIISVILHPLFVPFYMLLLLFNPAFNTYHVIPDKGKIILAAIVFFTTVLIPFLLNLIYIRLKLVSSLKMENREERIFPLLTEAVFLYLTYYILKNYQIPFIFSFYILGATFLVLFVFIITLFYKISLHMTAMGGVFGFLVSLGTLFHYPVIFPLLITILISGIVGTARLNISSHKTSEIYSGFLVGTTGMLLLFTIL